MRKVIELGSTVSVHYFVDENDIIQATSLEEPTWHTGKGFDAGNMNTISIEICSKGSNEEYKRAEENALFLIRQLMTNYNLTSDDIYFHRDFDTSFYCPHRILDNYSKTEWIEVNGLKEYSDYLTSSRERQERILRRV